MTHPLLVPTAVLPARLQLADVEALVRRGRHADAERLLRGQAAALTRRGCVADAAARLVALGRVQTERGRSVAAVRTLQAAVSLVRQNGEPPGFTTARIWLATTLVDAGQLAAGEALAREVRAEPGLDDRDRDWAAAVLARVSLWQGRFDEARALVDHIDPRPAVDDCVAFIESTATRVLLVTGDAFAAGQRLDRATARGPIAGDGAPWFAVGDILLATTRLRLLCATGRLREAEPLHRTLESEAARLRLPMRRLRASVVWAMALRRAGRVAEAQRHLSRARRLCRVLPPLVQESLLQDGGRVAVAWAPPSTVRSGDASVASCRGGAAGLAAFVDLCRACGGDPSATTSRAAEFVQGALGASGVEVIAAGGPVDAISSTGARVLAEGRVVGPIVTSVGQALGVPLRIDGRAVGALVVHTAEGRSVDGSWVVAAAAVLAEVVDARVRADRLLEASAHDLPGLLGVSTAMAAVRAAILRAAPAPFAVLVLGESGVGKELVARAIHARSARAPQRFCDLNCAALPDELVESELFGHARGAFTGAVSDRPGVFEEASGGTLFLDEVVDLSLRAQAKLLRVIQQHEVRRLGESRSRPVDVRLISAANRDPRSLASAGAFREDLVYRLDVVRIEVPPLRERQDDIEVLAHHFWEQCAARVGSRATLGGATLTALRAYTWPGNVRELQNVLATLAVAAPRDGRVGVDALPAFMREGTSPPGVRLDAARRDCDRAAVSAALVRAAGHRSRAARELGVSRQGLLKLMARVGLGS